MPFRLFSSAFYIAAAAVVLDIPQADAATFTYSIRTGANNSGAAGGYAESDRSSIQQDFTGTFTRGLSGSNGASAAAAQIFADPASGEIKLRANASSVAETRFGPRATSSSAAEFSVAETYTTTGSGSVIFNVHFDGVLDSSVQGDPFYLNGIPRVVTNQVLSLIQLRKNGFGDNVIDQFGTGALGGALGLGRIELDETTTTYLQISEGETFDLFYKARVAAGTNLSESGAAADALAGFFNTFTISYETTGTLQILGSDPAFLAGDGSDVSVVPVPASLPLLLGSMALLWGMFLRRDTPSV